MDSKEKYNQIVFLETIKTGKTPKRSGLGSRLYLLAGYTKPILCTLKRNIRNKRVQLSKEEKKLTNRLEYYKSTWGLGYHNGADTTTIRLSSEDMKVVFTKYLGDHIIDVWGPYIHVYFDPKVEINWGQLDADLLEKYPNKCRIDKRGFIYYDYR